MQCPECDHYLSRRTMFDVEVDYCSRCKGLWFDYGELETLGEQTGFRSSRLPRQILDRGIVPKRKKGLCPRCAAVKMAPRKLFGVTIDLCPDCHGIWLDSGEIQSIFITYRKNPKAEWFNEDGGWVESVGDSIKSFFSGIFKN